MNESQETISLHLNSGIPVLSLSGPPREPLRACLIETVETLLGAGHCELIVEINSRVGYFRREVNPALEWHEDLLRLKERVAARRGRMIVVLREPDLSLLSLSNALLWTKSEEEAVRWLKGVWRAVCETRLATRLTALTD